MSFPLFVPALALAGGLVLGATTNLEPKLALAVVTVSCATSVANLRRQRRVRLFVSLGVGFAAAGCAMGSVAHEDATRPPLKLAFQQEVAALAAAGEVVIVEGELAEDARPTPYGASLLIRVSHLVVEGRRRPADGGLRASVGGTLVGQSIDAWRSGRVLRAPVLLRRPSRYLNPGVPDQELVAARRGIALLGTIKSAALLEVIERGSWLEERAADARAAVRRGVAQSVGVINGRSAAIVTAILIGDRAGLDETTTRRLQEAGTYHVIAISGGNVAILAGLVLFSFRSSGASPRFSAVATAVILAAYAYVVGNEASVARATFAAIAYLLARASDHRTDPLNVLALAAFVLLSAAPLAVFDGGFVLTFGATLGILVGTAAIVQRVRPALDRLVPWGVRWLLPPVALGATTLAVEAALLPVSAALFSRVSFAGFILNFLAIPLMTLVQICGGIACLFIAIDEDLTAVVAFLAHVAAWLLVESARLVDYVPWLVRRVPPPPFIALGVYYFAWTTVLIGRHRLGRLGGRGLRAVVVASFLWMLAAPAPANAAGELQVTFLDVGQGDATLVRFPAGGSLLVDAAGGPGSFDIGSRVVAPALWALGIRRLDYLALTHGDPDHIGGATAVLRDFRPREVWEGIPVPPHEPMRAIREGAVAARAAWRRTGVGERLFIEGVEIRILHPPPADWERQRVRNDDSIVMELRYGDISVLLPGDIGREVEEDVAAQFEPARLRVVKAPHHGSGGSSSPAFVAAAVPRAVIFSAGHANRYGHPVPYVIVRYRQAGAAIFRTDEDGAVTFSTNGRAAVLTTQTGRRVDF